MTFIYGQFPWISLFLALTWGLYGLLRKNSPLDPTEGLFLETSLLSIPALIYILYLTFQDTSSFTTSISTGSLLAGTGIISGLPLIVFLKGVKLVPLSLIGILQYIYPTLIFACGYFVFNEPMNTGKMIGFAFIWIALIIYTLSEFTNYLKIKQA